MTKQPLWMALGLFLVFPIGLFGQDSTQLTFKEYVSSDGNYKVNFPGEPTLVKPANPTISINFQAVEVSKDLVFIVSYYDYPKRAQEPKPSDILDAVCKGNLGDGKMETDYKISEWDKLPARKLRIKKSNEKTGEVYIESLVILKGNRLYQLMVIGNKDAVQKNDVDKFQKSFKVTG